MECLSKPNPDDVWMNKPMVLLVHALEVGERILLYKEVTQ